MRGEAPGNLPHSGQQTSSFLRPDQIQRRQEIQHEEQQQQQQQQQTTNNKSLFSFCNPCVFVYDMFFQHANILKKNAIYTVKKTNNISI